MKALTLALLASLAITAPASAHEAARKEGASASLPTTGPNGGPLTSADGHPVEMVASGREIVFYVQDEDQKPLSTAGAGGRAIITQGGKNVTVQLTAAAPNKLSGHLAAPLETGAKVVFSTKIHGHVLQARFEKK